MVDWSAHRDPETVCREFFSTTEIQRLCAGSSSVPQRPRDCVQGVLQCHRDPDTVGKEFFSATEIQRLWAGSSSVPQRSRDCGQGVLQCHRDPDTVGREFFSATEIQTLWSGSSSVPQRSRHCAQEVLQYHRDPETVHRKFFSTTEIQRLCARSSSVPYPVCLCVGFCTRPVHSIRRRRRPEPEWRCGGSSLRLPRWFRRERLGVLFSLTASPGVVGRSGPSRASLQGSSVLPLTAALCHPPLL